MGAIEGVAYALKYLGMAVILAFIFMFIMYARDMEDRYTPVVIESNGEYQVKGSAHIYIEEGVTYVDIENIAADYRR